MQVSVSSIREELERIWQFGQDVDLTGVGYGRIHWTDETEIWDSPVSYYFFLAGWCRLFRARRVLEIGTHWGGSAVAMARGMMRGSPYPSEQLTLVTIDLTEESDNFLPNQAESSFIQKIVGDANSPDAIRKIAEAFGGRTVDLIYIDADHAEMPTFLNFAIYSALLKPRVVVCDDIELSDTMRAFWELAKSCATPEFAVNVVDYVPAVRAIDDVPSPGFGYLRLRP
jgi:Methyltransferase domain